MGIEITGSNMNMKVCKEFSFCKFEIFSIVTIVSTKCQKGQNVWDLTIDKGHKDLTPFHMFLLVRCPVEQVTYLSDITFNAQVTQESKQVFILVFPTAVVTLQIKCRWKTIISWSINKSINQTSTCHIRIMRKLIDVNKKHVCLSMKYHSCNMCF